MKDFDINGINLFPDLDTTKTNSSNTTLELFKGKPFYCWDTTKLTQDDCCFNHIIGLPMKPGTNIINPLFDYQDDLYKLWEQYKHLWIKKATGLGISEFFLRLMLWLCLRDSTYSGCQMCIVTGPNVNLAKKLIKRMKYLVINLPGFEWEKVTDYVLEVGGVTIECYPSHNLGSYRSLTAPKFIFLDEADFFPVGQFEDARDVAERYIGKSQPWIVMVSTPNKPNGLFERIENEPEDSCLYRREYLPYTIGLDKIYSQEDIQKAKASPSFEREYNLRYGFGLGDVFLPDEIDLCTTIPYDKNKPNQFSSKSMGIDAGFGSSKFAIVVTQLEDGIIKVMEAQQHARPTYEAMINKINTLRNKYKPTKIYVDGANPEFIKSIKANIPESQDYDRVIDQATKDHVDPEFMMKCVPVNFSTEGVKMLTHMQSLVSKGFVAIDKTFLELLKDMRVAKHIDGKLQKKSEDPNTYDLFDALRLSLRMYLDKAK
jgi:hypothetical protein